MNRITQIEHIDAVIAELRGTEKRMQARKEELMLETSEYLIFGTRKSGAAKRASLDLSMALAAWRNG